MQGQQMLDSNSSIIISGNPTYGVSEALNKVITADFFSRSHNNFDLCLEDVQNKFSCLSLNYNIYISCSSLGNFNQAKIIDKVYNTWIESSHTGHIIIIGSSIDIHSDLSRPYAKEKMALRNFSRKHATSLFKKNNGIRITYLAPGTLDTESMRKQKPEMAKINLDYLASTIKWLIDQPLNINICELTLDAFN